MNPHLNSRRAASVYHFVNRARERGIKDMTTKFAMKLNVMIMANNFSHLLEEVPTDRPDTRWFEVSYDGKPYLIVYRPYFNSVVTIYPHQEGSNNDADDASLEHQLLGKGEAD